MVDDLRRRRVEGDRDRVAGEDRRRRGRWPRGTARRRARVDLDRPRAGAGRDHVPRGDGARAHAVGGQAAQPVGGDLGLAAVGVDEAHAHAAALVAVEEHAVGAHPDVAVAQAAAPTPAWIGGRVRAPPRAGSRSRGRGPWPPASALLRLFRGFCGGGKVPRYEDPLALHAGLRPVRAAVRGPIHAVAGAEERLRPRVRREGEQDPRRRRARPAPRRAGATSLPRPRCGRARGPTPRRGRARATRGRSPSARRGRTASRCARRPTSGARRSAAHGREEDGVHGEERRERHRAHVPGGKPAPRGRTRWWRRPRRRARPARWRRPAPAPATPADGPTCRGWRWARTSSRRPPSAAAPRSCPRTPSGPPADTARAARRSPAPSTPVRAHVWPKSSETNSPAVAPTYTRGPRARIARTAPMSRRMGSEPCPSTRSQRCPQSLDRQSPESEPAKIVSVVTTGPDCCARSGTATRAPSRTKMKARTDTDTWTGLNGRSPLRTPGSSTARP